MTAAQPIDISSADLQTLPTMRHEIAVYCPFPLRSHPFDTWAIDGQAVQWCLDHRLVAQRMGCADGIAAALPHAPESTIIAATKWFYWGALVDDFWDDHPDLKQMVAHVGALQRVMYTGSDAPLRPGDEWAASLRDLRRELETVLTAAEMVWFRGEVAAWLEGQLWYTALQHGATPDLGTYLGMRWAKCGAATLVAFTAATMGCELPISELDDPPVRAFIEAVMWACTIINDVGSAAKERDAGTAKTNLITVLAAAHGLDTAAALIKAWQLYERIVSVAWHLQQQLRADPRPAVARLAADLPAWIPAGIHWAATTSRYREFTGTSTAGTAPKVTLSQTPILWDRDNLTPPPHPEIAWWWQELAEKGSR
ncbi:terpene synthase family protein (plasmid) [Nocardia sp. CA-084685]|uniref:terpene synthase family protein n=1 Tax=Nocardia sp. CA-084685 TaxID=3239970 RepID=UPI003D98C73D